MDIENEHVAKFFESKNFAFLATVNKDGSPQVTPVWIDLVKNNDEDSIILVNTAKGRLKHKNVSRDPRVSISMIDSETNPYSMITIKGKVIEQTTEGANLHIDDLAKRYLGTDTYPAHSADSERIILKIEPQQIFYIPPRYSQYLKKT
ncbi:MAG TPA: PPOX class F420-dependent oxidoreductase [Nitrososphaeraceae archaeon]